MEPISELATRITSHLWLLHDLYPDQESVSAILSEKYWPGDLERSAASDWSLLQLVLDLVSDSLNGESGAFGSESEPESLLRRIFHWKSEKARSKNAEETATPGKLASRAVEAMAQRMSTVQEQHLDCDLTFAATCPASALQNAGQLSPSKLLTREELFQNVANSLLRRKVSELHMLADAFLGKAQFLMEEEIDRCAKAIMEKAGKQTAAKTAADWSQKSKPEQRKLVLNRIELRCLCKQLAVPVPFSIVLSDELDEIARSRLVRLYGQEADPSSPPPAVEARDKCGIPSKLAVASQQGFESSLFGLALSGGGVRSATFALGLLQGMADRNLLPYIDILSTVSGGGYIGSWLISWIKRRGGIDVVQQSLRGSASLLTLGQDCPERRPANAGPNLSQPLQWVSRNSDPHSDHVRPVRLLRDYSRYLTPQAGFFSADSWTMAATWFRNTTLNLVVLALFFGAALLFPRFPILLLQYLGNKVENIVGPNPSAWKLLRTTFLTTFLASLPLLVSLIFIRWNLNTLWRALQGDRRASPGDSETWVLLKTLPCIWLGAFLELVVLWSSVHSEIAPWLVTACFVSPLALEVGIFWVHFRSPYEGVWHFLTRLPALVVTLIVGSLFFYLLYSELGTLIMNKERGVWIAGSAGFAMVLMWGAAIVLVLVGLFGRDLSDAHREWWSRLGAWLSLSIGAWVAMCAICFFMPWWIAMLGLKVAAAGISWMTITAAGVKFAFSPHSGRDSGSSNQSRLKAIIMYLAPAVFALGIVSVEAFALFWALKRLIDWWPRLADGSVTHQLCCTGASFTFQSIRDQYWQWMCTAEWLAPLFLIAAFSSACWYLASRVDINEFSMHNFYKNRLVRAYLGASRARAHRVPNAFTGFDFGDDIYLRRFQYGDKTQPRDKITDCRASYAGPFPIINAALNITRGEDLGIQDRKAESFIFTPLWSGFDFSRRQASVRQATLSEFAFQRTELFGEPGQGALLGTAMAISGAAFNANAGFHTQPTLAFLLTIFGVRLGWWAGNPRKAKWTSPSPGQGLLYLLMELTANTSTNSNFVLLSDGGHFENMGLYELVRRRCRFIILSDAEEDEKFKLEGIGGAIRKCRDDFGVVIDLNLDALQPIGEPGVSRLHYSLGTIIYPGECGCGKLIYIKSSVTGDEPIDIIEFRKRHSEFPHTSTANQFFTSPTLRAIVP